MDGQIIATVASDASGRVFGDAEVSLRYCADGDTARTFDTIKVPWQANQDQLTTALQGYGYAIDSGWDLLAVDDGYVLTTSLSLQMWWREPVLHNSETCRKAGKGICVQSRLVDRDGKLVLVNRFICDADGQLFSTESVGE